MDEVRRRMNEHGQLEEVTGERDLRANLANGEAKSL
jgi:hypothetical protein